LKNPFSRRGGDARLAGIAEAETPLAVAADPAPAGDAAASTPAQPPPGPEPDAVWAALGTVVDPEIGLDIVTVGLVYDVAIRGGEVRITYTLTTPGCPMEAIIRQGLLHAVRSVPGVESAEADLVWEPAWSPAMIREPSW
jgi:metal-sulfur cluster biosynthetic enzyme